VLRDVNFFIERGDRVALVGVNGAGKSTLIKLLTGVEPVTGGELKLGHNVEVDYFAQDQYKVLDPNARMLDDIADLSPRSTQTELRSLLGSFLFSDDDVFKTLGVLSGGERNRYALARMLLHPSNFLLLDEPTNHLDIRAKDVLLESLSKFQGTVVFVSHDRYFIDKLATRVFEIANGGVEVYPGNYEDYLRSKNRVAETPDISWISAHAPRNHNGEGAQAGAVEKAKRLNPIKEKQYQERMRTLEEQIERAENGIAECESALANFVSAEETKRQSELLEQRKAEVATLMTEWEQVSQTLEEANS
jgi:ATP-binding cassette subfamily F protein 3